MAARDGKTVDGYIEALGEPRAAIADRLRAAIRDGAPEATEEMKWGQPVYDAGGPVAALKAFPRWVTLTFWRGAELAAAGHGNGLLDGDGDRMRHVRFASPDAVNTDQVGALVREAIALNREHGDPTKRG